MTQYSTDSRTRKYVKVCGFLSFAREYENQILDKGLDASKKVAHRGSEFIGNKIVDAVTKSNDEVLYTFSPNKSSAYLLNVEPINLVFLKTYNSGFHEIIITFTDQNDRQLDIQDKVNLTLLINK